jgi:hypothetical protein
MPILNPVPVVQLNAQDPSFDRLCDYAKGSGSIISPIVLLLLKLSFHAAPRQEQCPSTPVFGNPPIPSL